MRNASGLKLIISRPNNTSARGHPRESAKCAKISLDIVGLRDAIPNSNMPSPFDFRSGRPERSRGAWFDTNAKDRGFQVVVNSLASRLTVTALNV